MISFVCGIIPHDYNLQNTNTGNTMDDNKQKALAAALGQIEKQFGRGAIMKMGADAIIADIPSISTGSLTLDLALGIGGLPRGRVAEIYGPESSGKTTMALHVIAQAQKTGGTCAFIDAEHALDMGYAQKLGIRGEELLLSQPDNGEQALEITETLVRSGALDVIVIDSVAALVPRAEIEGESPSLQHANRDQFLLDSRSLFQREITLGLGAANRRRSSRRGGPRSWRRRFR